MKYSSRDYEGFRNDMIELLKVKMPEYTDTSSSDAGIVILELFAYMLDILSYYIDIVANEMFMSTAKERESVIEHTKMLGYRMSGSTPSQFYQVFEITPQAEDYTIPKGYRIKTKSSSSEEAVYFETDEDLVIPATKTGLEQDGQLNYLYRVPITQGYTVEEDVIGTSLGTPTQEFGLNFSPIIEASILVYVNEGTGFVQWTKVDNFIDSILSSTHYMVETNENDNVKVIFGDGSSGKIPDTYQNGIMSTYRVGGGIIGNVGARTITEIEETKAEIVQTFNPDIAYVLGKEKEGVDTAKVKAIAQARSLWRAVTITDFEDLAILELEARKAKAIWDNSSQTLDLYVLPAEGDTLTIDSINYMIDFYEERKILGAKFLIHSPSYHVVDMTLVAKVFPNYRGKMNEIRTSMQDMITSLLAVGQKGFKEPFIPSEIVANLMGIEGLQSVYFTNPVSDISILDYEIVKKGTVTINISEGV